MELEKDNCKIYIVLTKTRTKVARLIRMYTREPYSHTSLSFDEDLSTLYSFARREINNPLNAGFIEEHVDTGIFGLDKEIMCAVYCLTIHMEEYNCIKQIIAELLQNPLEYGYNFGGLFTSAVNLAYSRPKKFFCSQFVAWILGSAGIKVVPKKYALTRPGDFRRCLKRYKIYEGNLHDYAEYHYRHKKLERLTEKRNISKRLYNKIGGYQSYENMA